jgi:long-chain-fatty-acid--CoA ligase ACSBG
MQKEAEYKGNTIMMSMNSYKDLVNSTDGKNVFWTDNQDTELPIKMPTSGIASAVQPYTIPEQLHATAAMRQNLPALKVMRNNKEQTWSWNQFVRDTRAFSKGLIKVGIDERKAINIMGFNAPEWAIAFFGSIFHNNVVSGVYITNTSQACLYQAQHSEAQILAVDTEEQLTLYMNIIDQLPEVKAIICWGIEKIPEQFAKDSRVFQWRDFMKLGDSVKEAQVDAIIEKQSPGQCCVLVYTSGTTGNPKGVMLSHDNMIFGNKIIVQ